MTDSGLSNPTRLNEAALKCPTGSGLRPEEEEVEERKKDVRGVDKG